MPSKVARFGQSRLLLVVAVQLCFYGIILLVWPRLPLDDSYVFLTYARTLAHTGLFAFNPGEVSYGFSSPLYVILLAATAKLTALPVTVALTHALGFVLCGLGAATVCELWAEIAEAPSTATLFLASVIFSGPWFFTAWFLCGMETGLAVLAVLGLFLWLAKLHADRPRLPWLPIGVVSAAILATTRLESGLYIGCILLLAAWTLKSKRKLLDLFAVGAFAASAELGWLLFANHTFGTYMPWTSTARLIYYLPVVLGVTGDQFYHLGFLPHCALALKAILRMTLGGPLKFLLFVFPIVGAVFFLARAASGTRQVFRWLLTLAALGILLEILTFAYLFPLVQNRHLAPYIAAVWVLIALPLASLIRSFKPGLRAAALLAVAGVWIAGTLQYRSLGTNIVSLFELAHSGLIQPSDRVAAEPIGVLSFETQAYIVDLGGLTERDVWPYLMYANARTAQRLNAWELSRGANKALVTCASIKDQQLRHFGGACLIDTRNAASELLP